MNWKEFFKPTLWKIITSILLIILAFFSTRSVDISTLCNCLPGPCPCPQPFPYGNILFKGIYYTLFFADYTTSLWAGTASGLVFNWMAVFILLLNLVYLYVISCLIVFLYKKFFPSDKQNI